MNEDRPTLSATELLRIERTFQRCIDSRSVDIARRQGHMVTLHLSRSPSVSMQQNGTPQLTNQHPTFYDIDFTEKSSLIFNLSFCLYVLF